jgi:dienelactone hydrolase
MGDLTSWDDLSAEITRLYEEKCYADAEAVVVAHGHRFPERQSTILYTRMCLAALLDEPERALTYFDDALKRDFWFRTTTLRSDPDLAILQGHPGFERMAKISFEREQIAQHNAQPHMAVAEPPGGKPPFPALIALHGNNSSTAFTHPHWQTASARGCIVATPQSTQVAGVDRFVWDDTKQAERTVTTQLEALRRDYPVDEKRLIIAGFSMGGRTACHVAIHGVIDCAGFVVFAPWLKGIEGWEPHIDAAVSRGLRAALIVGERDPGCYKDTLALHEMLKAHNMPCHLTVIPGGRHAYPETFETILSDSIAFVIKG